MPEQKTPVSGAFWLASLMYFCSGKPMHFCSGVDTRPLAEAARSCTWLCTLDRRMAPVSMGKIVLSC